MNKPVYLGLSILELSKILLYEFWYDYVNPKYGKKAKLCCMGTDSFIVWVQIFSLFTEKQMRFTKILQKMLKQYLTLQSLN